MLQKAYIAGLVAAMMAVFCAKCWPGSEEALRSCDIGYDGLLVGLLDVTASDSVFVDSEPGKEESLDICIDGQPGKLRKGWFSNGKQQYQWSTEGGLKKHGKEVRWNDRGQKVYESTFDRGLLEGPNLRWYTSGQKSEEAHYRHHMLNGVHRTWYRNGRLWMEATYKNGVRHGAFTLWYPNGAKHCHALFNNDSLEGIWRKWSSDGTLIRRVDHSAKVAEKGVGKADSLLSFTQEEGAMGGPSFHLSPGGAIRVSYYVLADVVYQGQLIRQSQLRSCEFDLTEALFVRLKDLLKEVKPESLKDKYINDGASDGIRWRVSIRDKHVYCYNQFPERLRKLSKSIRDEILMNFRAELITASRDRLTTD